ncbi:MAG: radical SAM protein [Candidatus Glassbacteria bacterium]
MIENGLHKKETSLRRVDLQTSLVYGPVSSRRLGKSLGINPITPGRKVCSFNCVYCQYDAEKPVWPPSEIDKSLFASIRDIESRLREELIVLSEKGNRIDYITFAGNGEPTLHPDFPELVGMVLTVRDLLNPQAKTAVLTNGSTLVKEPIRKAVGMLDKAIVKLDAASQRSLIRVNRPYNGFELTDILNALSELENLVVQILLFGGTLTNATEEDLKVLIDTLNIIHPNEIQLYSLDRAPAKDGIVPIPRSALIQIADRLRTETGLCVTVY